MSDYDEETISEELDKKIHENILKWHCGESPLAALLPEQLDYLDQLEDELKAKELSSGAETVLEEDVVQASGRKRFPPVNGTRDFIHWMLAVEQEIHEEKLYPYSLHCERLRKQRTDCANLYENVIEASNLLDKMKEKYVEITSKTDSVHTLSDQLVSEEAILKRKYDEIQERLHYFVIFPNVQEAIEKSSNRNINTEDFTNTLETIQKAIEYLNEHIDFKDSRIYRIKYESLLTSALNRCYHYVNAVITEATKQLGSATTELQENESTFTLFYGKFHNAAAKVQHILRYLEGVAPSNEQFQQILCDCQKAYTSQRLRILTVAVNKALTQLRETHRTDHSVQFRACVLFMLKTCQDEAQCYGYFFFTGTTARSQQQGHSDAVELQSYLGALCQHLYDVLRPSLIIMNHVEVLTELCGILRRELFSNRVSNDNTLHRFRETVAQLLQDVEERLVFRTNVFFQHDLLGYKPSHGDLAYPEKLQQMENIAQELCETRAESRTSSQEFQEVSQVTNIIRSYTGNSPADLHGMWYPTVKRTLVILSRLYTSLDRATFQGLAQEALLICAKTIETAQITISKKCDLDGRLFQIKHLLILREQIAPFQVDFTTTEFVLDFSPVQKAAVDLIWNKRDKIFSLTSNNALLEFLLEGTPRVREYLIDSRKELDKKLKTACEVFISTAVRQVCNQLQVWIQWAEFTLHRLSMMATESSNKGDKKFIPLPQQTNGKASHLAGIVAETMRNFKVRIPEIQRAMQLYLANRETEFILFRPIKNQLVNTFIQLEQVMNSAQYSVEERLVIACPTAEQISVLICSVTLATGESSIPQESTVIGDEKFAVKSSSSG